MKYVTCLLFSSKQPTTQLTLSSAILSVFSRVTCLGISFWGGVGGAGPFLVCRMLQAELRTLGLT